MIKNPPNILIKYLFENHLGKDNIFIHSEYTRNNKILQRIIYDEITYIIENNDIYYAISDYNIVDMDSRSQPYIILNLEYDTDCKLLNLKLFNNELYMARYYEYGGIL